MHALDERQRDIHQWLSSPHCSQHASETSSPGKVEEKAEKSTWVWKAKENESMPVAIYQVSVLICLSLSSKTACPMQQLEASSRWSCPHPLSVLQDRGAAKSIRGGTQKGSEAPTVSDEDSKTTQVTSQNHLPVHQGPSQYRSLKEAPWELHAFQGGL